MFITDIEMQEMQEIQEANIETQGTKKKNFTQLQNEIIDSMSFKKPIDKLLYITLLRFAFGKKKASPSLTTLANACCVSKKSTVIDALQRLVAMALITIKKRTKQDGDNETNLYYIHDLTAEMKQNSVLSREAKKEKKEAKKAAKKVVDNSRKSEGGSPKNGLGGSPKNGLGVVRKTDSNNIHSQEEKENKKIMCNKDRYISIDTVSKINKITNEILTSFLLSNDLGLNDSQAEKTILVWNSMKTAIQGDSEAKANLFIEALTTTKQYMTTKNKGFDNYLRKVVRDLIKKQSHTPSKGTSDKIEELSETDMIDFINKCADKDKLVSDLVAAEMQLITRTPIPEFYKRIKYYAEKNKLFVV